MSDADIGIDDGPPPGDQDTEGLEPLLDYLKRSRGFDFTGYKHSTLTRRIRKRMEVVHCDAYGAYMDYLQVHPEEFTFLFNTILINVTGFFRDAPAWTYLAEEIMPRLLASRPPDRPIRVWDVGCASGEETYSLAMVLSEALGEDRFRERVKIYATDVDEEALSSARDAAYTARQVDLARNAGGTLAVVDGQPRLVNSPSAWNEWTLRETSSGWTIRERQSSPQPRYLSVDKEGKVMLVSEPGEGAYWKLTPNVKRLFRI